MILVCCNNCIIKGRKYCICICILYLTIDCKIVNVDICRRKLQNVQFSKVPAWKIDRRWRLSIRVCILVICLGLCFQLSVKWLLAKRFHHSCNLHKLFCIVLNENWLEKFGAPNEMIKITSKSKKNGWKIVGNFWEKNGATLGV